MAKSIILADGVSILKFTPSKAKTYAEKTRFKDGILVIQTSKTLWTYTGDSKKWIGLVDNEWAQWDQHWWNFEFLKKKQIVPEGIQFNTMNFFNVASSINHAFFFPNRDIFSKNSIENTFNKETMIKWDTCAKRSNYTKLPLIAIDNYSPFLSFPSDLFKIIFSKIQKSIIDDTENCMINHIKESGIYPLPNLRVYENLVQLRLVCKVFCDEIPLKQCQGKYGHLPCKKNIPVYFERIYCKDNCIGLRKCINCGIYEPKCGYACINCYMIKYLRYSVETKSYDSEITKMGNSIWNEYIVKKSEIWNWFGVLNDEIFTSDTSITMSLTEERTKQIEKDLGIILPLTTIHYKNDYIKNFLPKNDIFYF